ncbi:hypothetical protein LX15_005087 [Streptoalloteichus tenebrarius]|uniref:REase associating with pPIWI RE domain-containing protein n=1 Tax=Streptoalloteichus tenebrarius (strain ATCC 17920 / DSM 40477 / JCM 4838 / CBS 697.72 / NBRC 16177 / NCIMB 11028 / NRRL B-12390 / A12253. 1 / ISP 5477) TaxID=1933 RepID=A0ABT1I0P7_STRSD|nr:hypothetical protein [Streptoalloteichus tenebrarius]MCP2261363.1 hypothetical protein [Streptoalloteichus tenebrarius]BFF00901.1 hypothetical protein GCM10020241_25760 [Streptoalloteichus tenebrarius]
MTSVIEPTVADDGSFFDGPRLLRMIATAMYRLSQQPVRNDQVYRDEVQSAFNHLVLLCLRRGVDPPASVPEMARWASEKPLGEWPLRLPEELTAIEWYLVDAETRVPTQQCLEWVVFAPNVAAEQFENELLGEALARSRAGNAPQTYVAFRRLLIERPVLTGIERTLLGQDLALGLLHETIRRAYEPAPAAYLSDGVFAQCARCHCLLVPTRHGYRCELESCRRDGHPRVGRVLSPRENDGVYQVSRPLRIFITGPGLAETRLETAVRGLGLEPEMWPNYDRYDLRIVFPDQKVWAIDVKDRADPALLARTMGPFPANPPFDRAFLVVPRYRFQVREDYRRVFLNHLPDDLRQHVELLSDEELVREARSKLRRVRAIQRQMDPAPEETFDA